jgi:hypothetical protein
VSPGSSRASVPRPSRGAWSQCGRNFGPSAPDRKSGDTPAPSRIQARAPDRKSGAQLRASHRCGELVVDRRPGTRLGGGLLAYFGVGCCSGWRAGRTGKLATGRWGTNLFTAIRGRPSPAGRPAVLLCVLLGPARRDSFMLRVRHCRANVSAAIGGSGRNCPGRT